MSFQRLQRYCWVESSGLLGLAQFCKFLLMRLPLLSDRNGSNPLRDVDALRIETINSKIRSVDCAELGFVLKKRDER